MVKTNGFAGHKVFRTSTLVLIGFFFALNLFATELVSKRDRWVDSVYHSLSIEQRIQQLLFPIIEYSDDFSIECGGVITDGDLEIRIEQVGGLPILNGLMSGDYAFQSELNIKPEMLASTNNEDLFQTAGFLSGLQLNKKGYNFTILPDSKYPITTSSTKRNEQFIKSYQAGMDYAGIGTWHIKRPRKYGSNDALNLGSYLSKYDLGVGRLRKKDLKKLRRSDNNKALIFYRTNHTDLNLSEAILAADVLVFEDDYQYYLDHIATMISKKKLRRKLFEQKVKKVLTIKHRIGKVPKILKPDDIAEKLFVRKVWEQAATIVKNEDDIIPIKRLDDRSFASLSLGVFKTNVFQKTLDHYTYFSHFEEADFLHNEQRLQDILTHYDFVIAGFSFPDLADANNQDIQQRINFLETLSKKTKVVVVVFAEPKWPANFTNPHAVILGHINDSAIQLVVPQIIFGAIPASGKLPFDLNDEITQGTGYSTKHLNRLRYSIPEDEGFDPEMEKKIDFIASKAIENFATPGCQVLVARNGDVVLNKAYGFYTYDSAQSVSTETLYDLASVTKVTGTLQATMFLEGQGAFHLDDKASSILDELKESDKEDLVLRKILAHQAGLQPYFPFYKKTFSGDRLNPDYFQKSEQNDYNKTIAPGLFGHQALEDSVWNWTINSTLRKKPEWQEEYDYTYSDLGFLIMFKLNERLINQPMEEFLSQNFYDPLGMFSTCYQPLCRFPIHNIAPTELDYDFRNALIWGMVHDENAALTGGVGGHAGLFSTANDLAKLLQMNLQDGYYGGIQYIKKGTISKFTQKQFPGNRRGLGWDKPVIGEYQNTARYSSHETFGHLGFTGTAVWVDPEYNLIYIFLSNRIHPNRENDKLMVDNIRSRIHEVIYESMPEYRQGS